MSPQRLPSVALSAKASYSSPASQRRQNATRRKPRPPHPGPPPVLLSNSALTPWGGPALSASSFASIPPAPPLRPPPAPQPTPSTPNHCTVHQDDDASTTSFSSDAQSPSVGAPQSPITVCTDKGLRPKRKVLPQRGHPRPPRLPPLRPITDLSFSRSFTFSFFELPLDQSPRCRAERAKNLLLLLKQIRY
ncbi:WAS/WASL-interacting protein family member 3 isoform X2 [Gouania willdenowi]|uniref:WAS/WASL-interacting protein family member 3 isoform X2 n=1 Tax=Gouania willdenowi TaxID=441366 RepID=UPI0010554FD3|nr:WAS/WASL-interacting protein family member 3-like isoform X2 [Gouania willdenowi]